MFGKGRVRGLACAVALTVSSGAFAAITVAPADRLALADRLFNKGEYSSARAEYQALAGAKGLAADDILYRYAECERALGRPAEARAAYGALVSKHPSSRHLHRAMLMRALCAPEAARVSELKALDAAGVEHSVRAAALYHLALAANDAELFRRAEKADPKGRYAPYAKLRRGAILAKSSDPAQRRTALEQLLEIAFGTDRELAEGALHLAATVCFDEKRYGEAASLWKRYLKNFPNGANAADALTCCAWCDYLSGRYADAIALCGDGLTDDLAYLRAAAVRATGDEVRARTLFQSYLEKWPAGRHRAEAELPLAQMAFDAAEKANDAAALVESAKRSAALSKSASDRLRLAWAYEKVKRPAEAEREYLGIARDFPGSSEAAEALYRKALGDLRAEKWSAADLALKEALAGKLDSTRRGEALYWRGVAAVRLGHAEEGGCALKEALTAGLALDQDREARLILADVDYNAGRIADAKAAYAKLVREGAVERMSAAKQLAVGRLLGGEGARTCASALVKGTSPEWRQAGWALLGDVESDAGLSVAAAEAYRKAMAETCVTEDLPRVAARLGALETKSGEYDLAAKTLKRAIELNPADANVRAEAYLHLAETAEAKNDFENARAYATVVTALFEKTPFAADAKRILDAHPEGGK